MYKLSILESEGLVLFLILLYHGEVHIPSPQYKCFMIWIKSMFSAYIILTVEPIICFCFMYNHWLFPELIILCFALFFHLIIYVPLIKLTQVPYLGTLFSIWLRPFGLYINFILLRVSFTEFSYCFILYYLLFTEGCYHRISHHYHVKNLLYSQSVFL